MYAQVVMLWLDLALQLLEKASRLVENMRPRCRYGLSNVKSLDSLGLRSRDTSVEAK